MEERKRPVDSDDVVDPRKYFEVFRKIWWKIGLLSMAVGLVTLIVLFQMPNIYQATAVITPAIDEKRQNPALGALVAIGVDIGGPSRVEDLETLFKSEDLTIRVFRKYGLWPIVMPERYDPKTGKMKALWTDRIVGSSSEPKAPNDWDAIRAAKDALKISVNKKSGTLSVSFLTASPGNSPRIVGYYLEEAKNRLQEEALDRAMRNKKFIETQLSKTVDVVARERLYSLFGQEVEKEMLAHNREQFGFKIIDTPKVPDRKTGPKRAQSAFLATIIAFCLITGYQLLKGDPS